MNSSSLGEIPCDLDDLADRDFFGKGRNVSQSTAAPLGESTIWKYPVRNRKAK